MPVAFLFTSDKGGGICFRPHARVRVSVCLSVCVQDYSKTRAWIWMKCCMSTDVETWTNWLTFEPNPDHSPDPGTGFTPDFWILAGYLNKLWTDFDEILWVDSCGGRVHDLVTFWAGSRSESGSWIRTCIQNCKADSAISNRRVSMKFYEWIACESRKTAFNFGSDTDHIRDAVSVTGFYPDYWLRRILTKFGAEVAPTTAKSWVSCRSSRSKVKVKHNKNTLTELSDNDLCRR